MADNTTISNAAAIAACDAIVDLFDQNSTAKIYTGSQPANPDVAVGAQTLLGTLTYSDATPWGAAADAAPGGRSTAGTIGSDTSADATGTAAWFRLATSGGTAHVDGNVATSGASLNLSTTAIVAGAEIAFSSHTITMPETQPA